jgi:hypothetical protein
MFSYYDCPQNLIKNRRFLYDSTYDLARIGIQKKFNRVDIEPETTIREYTTKEAQRTHEARYYEDFYEKTTPRIQ